MTAPDIAALVERVKTARESATPGPWKIEDWDENVVSDEAGEWLIAQGMPDCGWPINQTKGNSCLIALAPEMADALLAQQAEIERLREALPACMSMCVDHRDELLRDFCAFGTNDRATMDADEAEWVEEWDAAIEKARDALTTGGQHD